jgi:hypothetical protein
MSKFETPYGKGISTFIAPNTTHVKIKFDQGGELPERLQGLFTSVREADKAIISYIEQDKPVEKKLKPKE